MPSKKYEGTDFTIKSTGLSHFDVNITVTLWVKQGWLHSFPEILNLQYQALWTNCKLRAYFKSIIIFVYMYSSTSISSLKLSANAGFEGRIYTPATLCSGESYRVTLRIYSAYFLLISTVKFVSVTRALRRESSISAQDLFFLQEL